MAEDKKRTSEEYTCMACKGKKICSECGYRGHIGYFNVLRIALMLLILGMVFFLGLKIGEFKGMFEGRYGEENCMMRNCFYTEHYMMYNQPNQMMPVHQNVSTTSIPRAATTTRQTGL
jgi:hypothetical protein